MNGVIRHVICGTARSCVSIDRDGAHDVADCHVFEVVGCRHQVRITSQNIVVADRGDRSRRRIDRHQLTNGVVDITPISVAIQLSVRTHRNVADRGDTVFDIVDHSSLEWIDGLEVVFPGNKQRHVLEVERPDVRLQSGTVELVGR